MHDRAKKFLFDVLTACDEIAAFLADKTRDDYLSDVLLRRGIERDLEIIGEGLSNLRAAEPAMAERIPDIHRVIGMRHRLIHAYDDVDDNIVWDAVQFDLPALRDVVKRLLDE